MDELWMTEDVCEKAQCAFDTNGEPIIKTQREVCNTICQAVSFCLCCAFELRTTQFIRNLYGFELKFHTPAFHNSGIRAEAHRGQVLR
jgi:hypothetical protein